MKTNVTQVMVDEHQLILRMIALVEHNTALLEAVELGFLPDLAEVMVVSGRARIESRGAHFREDYPNRDDVNFMRHTMAYKVGTGPDAEVRLDYKPVVQTRYEPMERKY